MPDSTQKLETVVWLVLTALLLPIAGVAGSESAVKPLRVTGRVLRAGELPGFVPKERPAAVTSVAAWNKVAPSDGIDVRARLRRAGFVAAVREDLEWTKGSDRAALSAVVRLGSARAARAEIAQQVRDFAAAPNRGRVKTYTPFAVPGIPGAHGLTLTDDRGGEGHNIIFADGPFTYLIGVGWGAQAKDPPTRAQLISAATTLYKRVHARPAHDGGTNRSCGLVIVRSQPAWLRHIPDAPPKGLERSLRECAGMSLERRELYQPTSEMISTSSSRR